MAAGCPRLRWLNLTWCVKLTDRGLQRLAQHCGGLRWLSLHGVGGVSMEGLAALSTACSHSLHTLDVQGCSSGSLSRAEVAQLFPRVRTWVVHG